MIKEESSRINVLRLAVRKAGIAAAALALLLMLCSGIPWSGALADAEIPLTLGNPVQVTIPAGKKVHFSFVPEETCPYIFESHGWWDTVGILYNGYYHGELEYNDNGGENHNFSISYTLTANTMYIFGVGLNDPEQSATVTVMIRKDDATMNSGGFDFRLLSDGTASITRCYLTGDIIIPETLDGYTVTNLVRELFMDNNKITSVTIPATVTYFGTDRNDNRWDYVFSYCSSLKNIHVDQDNPSFSSVDGVLYNKAGTSLINYPCNHPGEVYHVSAPILCCTSFASCQNLKFLFLDNPDTWWYTYTFCNTAETTVFYQEGGISERRLAIDTESDCTFVSSGSIAKLPSNLERIEPQAFRNTDISYLYIPDSCRRIEAGAFADSSLIFVSVDGETVTEDGAFGDSVIVERRSP